jgi:hypothetical protein
LNAQKVTLVRYQCDVLSERDVLSIGVQPTQKAGGWPMNLSDSIHRDANCSRLLASPLKQDVHAQRLSQPLTDLITSTAHIG